MSFFSHAFILSLVCVGSAACNCFSQDSSSNSDGLIDYNEAVALRKWRWEDSGGGFLLQSLIPSEKYGYKLETLEDGFGLQISVTSADGDVYSWKGHYRSVFKIVGDRLYYAKYSAVGSGGEIVAVDLVEGKELWQKKLKALGPISHLGYANTIRLEGGHRAIWIWGKESLGRYVEVKNPESGETIAHKIFPKQKMNNHEDDPNVVP